MYAITLALLVVVSGSFGVSQAYAQQYNQYGNMDPYWDVPHTSGLNAGASDYKPTVGTATTTLGDVLTAINKLIADMMGVGSINHSDLQTIITNQNTEIKNQQAEIDLLKTLVDNTTPPNSHPIGATSSQGIITGNEVNTIIRTTNQPYCTMTSTGIKC